MSIRVAINGFGRIGRSVFRVLLENPDVEVVAINDLHEERILAHLLKYDSVHGKYGKGVTSGVGWMAVDGKKVSMIRQPSPEGLPWRELDVDVVIEATGVFTSRGASRDHLAAGSRKVIISAPSEDADVTIVLGVNHKNYDPAVHDVISNASCTTNCIAPVIKVLNDTFGVEKGLVTTVHSYTKDQSLLDHAHQDLRRARAAAISIIPTTTGAAKAVGLVLPELSDKLDGVSVRVPIADVSLADITLQLSSHVSSAAVNEALKSASERELRGVLGYSDEPLVSNDYKGSTFSAVVDGMQTRIVDGDMVKVTAWYDNEWGYANRLSEALSFIFA